MPEYKRPHIDPLEFRDAGGNIIDYGNRWAHLEGPPEDSYSVEEHPERFAPLYEIADALIDHLAETYEADIEEGVHVTQGLEHPPPATEIKRAVRFSPKTPGGAPLVIILTTYPAVRIYAGCFFTTSYPSCGCNACDERWNESADEFEWQLFAIIGGGFSEVVSEPRRPKWSFEWGRGLTQGMGQTISHRLRALDGSSEVSGASRVESVPPARLEEAQNTLRQVAALGASVSRETKGAQAQWLPWGRA